MELESNTKVVTKEKLSQKLIVKDVVKTKMTMVAGQMFIQYERELDESNQIIKSHENFFGDDKIKIDVLNIVFEINITENVNSEKNEIYKNKLYQQFYKNFKY